MMRADSSKRLTVLSEAERRALYGHVLGDNDWRTIEKPNFPGAMVDGINNSGEVLGAWVDSNGSEHDFVEKNGNFTNLSLPAGASLFESPAAINDAGTIVGGLQNGQVFIDQAGKITTFDPAPQPAAIYDLHINDTGEVAGTTGSGAFLYDKGTVTSIPGADAVTGINNAGQVVGEYFPPTAGHRMGFVYSDGTFTSIDPPGSMGTYPSGINNSGEIIGNWIDSNGTQHGFIATPTGAVTSTSTDLSTANIPLSKLFGSVPAADLLPETRMMAPSTWAAQLHSASGAALGAPTYLDASTIVMPHLHGGGH
jgi:probable HAF family extracellular repeat protein